MANEKMKDNFDSHYARKYLLGEIKFTDIPQEHREEVKREFEANGIGEYFEPEG